MLLSREVQGLELLELHVFLAPNQKPYAMHIAPVLTATDMRRQNLSTLKRKMILLSLTITRRSLTNEANLTTTRRPAPAGKGLPAEPAMLDFGGTWNAHIRTTTIWLKRSRNPTTITNAPVSTCALTSSMKSENPT